MMNMPDLSRLKNTMADLLRTHCLRVILPVVVVLVLGGGALVLADDKAATHGKTASPTPALTVTRVRPYHTSWPDTLEVSGAIAPWQEAVIGTQVGGYRLIDIRVNVGDVVKRGQVLAKLDAALLKTEEAQLKAALAQARVSASQAEANRQRALGAQEGGGISKQDVLQYVSQADTAQAQLVSAQAQLQAKELQLQYTNVLAPDDGVISSRSATLGAVVPIGQELFRMIRQRRLEWRGELTAVQLLKVQPDQLIQLTLPDGSSASAKVRQTAPSLDSSSRLGLVYADLAPGSRARAGMYANGHITLAHSPALVIPAASVVIRDGSSYVLRLSSLQPITKVALQPVTVGRRQGQNVEIIQGLTGSEQVVLQGAGFLNDGDLVRVEATPATKG